MLITIITPTFNSENTLENCLKSVRDQKYHNYEQIGTKYLQTWKK